MGYQVLIYEVLPKRNRLVGRLKRGEAVPGCGTYYHHPNQARKARDSWLRKQTTGTWRVEVLTVFGEVVEVVEVTKGGET